MRNILLAILFLCTLGSCKKESDIPKEETVTDIDGNVYKTVKIGTQIWMAENLKTTKFRDGTSIPNVTDINEWENLASSGFCWYENNSENKDNYGALYNWYAVNSCELAPIGWHIPTVDEFMTTLHEFSNTILFNAVMGGARGIPVSQGKRTYIFQQINLRGYWWTSTKSPYGQTGGRYFYVDNSNHTGDSYGLPQPGYSVRCVKDTEPVNATIPIVNTIDASFITTTTAISGGSISSSGGSSIIARGLCWNTTGNPTITENKTMDSNGFGSFTSNLNDLIANTTYYIRAYATNSIGTGYGIQLSFTTRPIGEKNIVIDIDGNVYHTVTIGNQTWMVENLKTVRYNDGTSIPLITGEITWGNLTTPAYCWYNNDAAYKNIYGALYNWYAVNTGKLCPKGWHVPTVAEWTKLEAFLGYGKNVGGKLKEAGTDHWESPNANATNEAGFTALPGGLRVSSGFHYIRSYGYWWSSTEIYDEFAWSQELEYNSSYLDYSYVSKYCGYSVRCIKD